VVQLISAAANIDTIKRRPVEPPPLKHLDLFVVSQLTCDSARVAHRPSGPLEGFLISG